MLAACTFEAHSRHGRSMLAARSQHLAQLQLARRVHGSENHGLRADLGRDSAGVDFVQPARVQRAPREHGVAALAERGEGL